MNPDSSRAAPPDLHKRPCRRDAAQSGQCRQARRRGRFPQCRVCGEPRVLRSRGQSGRPGARGRTAVVGARLRRTARYRGAARIEPRGPCDRVRRARVSDHRVSTELESGQQLCAELGDRRRADGVHLRLGRVAPTRCAATDDAVVRGARHCTRDHLERPVRVLGRARARADGRSESLRDTDVPGLDTARASPSDVRLGPRLDDTHRACTDRGIELRAVAVDHRDILADVATDRRRRIRCVGIDCRGQTPCVAPRSSFTSGSRWQRVSSRSP